MAKLKTNYSCNSCGATFPRWQGKCDDCGAWNSISEQVPSTTFQNKKSKAQSAAIISLDTPYEDMPRLKTSMEEFNRVLGGGFVPGSAILLGGDPGIGKSTILLQTAAHLSERGHETLYISGEESAHQIQNRAERLGLKNAPLKLANTGILEVAIATLNEHKPAVLIVDSIQTLHSEQLDSAPGTVSQVRLCAHELTQAAKNTDTVVIFVGHVTKDGNIAGPKVLEHMVDTVLYFEGDRGHTFRLLRSFKNRFGATGEIGVFDMQEKGLAEVTNPSALFLEERPEDAPGSVVMAAMNGTRPVLIEVQALVSATNLAQPRRTTLGVDPNRVAMIAAVLEKVAGFPLSNHDLYVNITGGMKVQEPAADMAIASALISSLMNKSVPSNKLVFGEIGLSGEVRNVAGSPARIKEAEKLGFKTCLSPNLGKDVTSKKLHIQAIRSVNDISRNLFDE